MHFSAWPCLSHLQQAFSSVKAEMRELLAKHHVTQMTMKPVKRQYAFENPAVQHGQQWVLKASQFAGCSLLQEGYLACNWLEAVSSSPIVTQLLLCWLDCAQPLSPSCVLCGPLCRSNTLPTSRPCLLA